jgi:GAF domain-containing protein
VGSDGGAYGVLSAHTRDRRSFTHHDVTFLEAVAHVLAMSLRRRQAEEDAERSHRVRESVIEGTTDSVLVKDLYDRFHDDGGSLDAGQELFGGDELVRRVLDAA